MAQTQDVVASFEMIEHLWDVQTHATCQPPAPKPPPLSTLWPGETGPQRLGGWFKNRGVNAEAPPDLMLGDEMLLERVLRGWRRLGLRQGGQGAERNRKRD